MASVPLLGRVARRLPLAAMTAGVAGLSAIANAIAAGAPAGLPPTRLGASIQQSMQERDEARARQQRALDMREQAVRASQARLRADMEKQPSVEGDRPVDSRADAQDRGASPYDELSRIYQTMKPARAAPIFERLDLDVQTAVARRMRERSAAMIMASMSPDAAVRLSMALAGKRVEDRTMAQRAPGPGKAVSGEPAGRAKTAPVAGAAPPKPPVPARASQQAQQTPKPTAAAPEKS